MFLGGSNYIGDIGTDRYIDPNSPAIGLLYKWNVTNRYSLRGGFTLTKLVETEYNKEDHRYRFWCKRILPTWKRLV